MTEQNPIREIVAALQSGNPAQAERMCRLHLTRDPTNESLLLLLALTLQRQDRNDEAIEYYAALTEHLPQNAAHWSNYATALRLAGKLSEAVEAASRATQLAPHEAAHFVALGLAQLQRSEHAAAQESLLKACELDPSSPEAHIHAASALVAVRDAQAYTLLRSWRSWLPLDAPEQLLLAHLLMTIGDAEDAHEVLGELVRRAPMHLPARLQLISLHERMNRLDLAESLLADTAALYPTRDQEAFETAHLRATLAARRSSHAEARDILLNAGPSAPLDYTHYFQLAAIQDKLGDTAGAMASLALAHARQVEELTPIAPECFAADAAIMPKAGKRITADDYAKWPSLVGPEMEDSPIFIVGFPRSGTTLLEQMLDAHPGLQSMDERPFFTILTSELVDHGVNVPKDLYRLNQRDCNELRARYYSLVAEKIRLRRDARLVDKNPLNMLCLPLIQRLFPHAKIILALRHPCDVVLSNYMQSYRSCSLASACSTLERTAKAYVAVMQAWLRDRDLIQPDVLISRYEELVADPARQTERYGAFLGLDDATPMLRFDQHARDKGFIATPSYTGVIQPINRKAMDRWRRYEREFQSVLPILAPMLEHWGYPAQINA